MIAGGNYREQATRIDMNGPAPTAASKIVMNQLVENTNVLESAATPTEHFERCYWRTGEIPIS